jgi:hypothetical protein
MRTAIAHCIKSMRSVNTKYGPKVVAEIEIQGQPKREFWLSPKQGEKLGECFDELQRHGGYSTKHAECHIVIEDGERGPRFVWCGIHSPHHSELDFLESRFDVVCESPYIGRPDAAPREAADCLKDN